jgi:N-acetylmuramoyl-L-alanine amidase
MRPINRIIIHCTATPEGRHHTAADIDRWHRERGWAGNGYHFVIQLDGTRETGRPIEQAGAHVKGHNADSIGIVYVGGCDRNMRPKDTRTDAQKTGLLCLLRELRAKWPKAQIIGHNDLDGGKACPSFDARAEYANI